MLRRLIIGVGILVAALSEPAEAVVLVDVDALHRFPGSGGVRPFSAGAAGFRDGAPHATMQTFVATTSGRFTAIRLQIGMSPTDSDLIASIVTLDPLNQPDTVLASTPIVIDSGRIRGDLDGDLLTLGFTPFAVEAGDALGILFEPTPSDTDYMVFFKTGFFDNDKREFRSGYDDGALLRSNNGGPFTSLDDVDFGLQTLVEVETPAVTAIPLPPTVVLLFGGLGVLALTRRS
ncbi:MAG: hypothetical protein AAF577_08685 [Pseudomonadota bacterium]